MRQTLPTLLYFLSVFLLPEIRAYKSMRRDAPQCTISPILDTCAYIETPLINILDAITGSNSSVTTREDGFIVKACFCTSTIHSFLDASHLEIGDMDTTNVEDAFDAYIVESHDAQHCIYPSHAVAQCSKGDPCGFECSNGFRRSSYQFRGKKTNTCTCPQPNTVCDGQCGSFPDGCPSTTSDPEEESARYSNPFYPGHRLSPGSTTSSDSNTDTPADSFYHAQAQQAQDFGCAVHESLCGVNAPRGRLTTECVDTRYSLESCGGCLVPPPSPFSAYDDESTYSKRQDALGVDCSSLIGVEDVSCFAGRCLVQACEVGWMVASSGDHCVPNRSSKDAAPEGDGTTNDESDSARYEPARMPLIQPGSSATTSDTSTSTDSPTSPSDSAASTPSGQFQDDAADASSPPSDSDAASSENTAPDQFSNEHTGANSESGSGSGSDSDATPSEHPASDQFSNAHSGENPDSDSEPASYQSSNAPTGDTSQSVSDPATSTDRPGSGSSFVGSAGAAPGDNGNFGTSVLGAPDEVTSPTTGLSTVGASAHFGKFAANFRGGDDSEGGANAPDTATSGTSGLTVKLTETAGGSPTGAGTGIGTEINSSGDPVNGGGTVVAPAVDGLDRAAAEAGLPGDDAVGPLLSAMIAEDLGDGARASDKLGLELGRFMTGAPIPDAGDTAPGIGVVANSSGPSDSVGPTTGLASGSGTGAGPDGVHASPSIPGVQVGVADSPINPAGNSLPGGQEQGLDNGGLSAGLNQNVSDPEASLPVASVSAPSPAVPEAVSAEMPNVIEPSINVGAGDVENTTHS